MTSYDDHKTINRSLFYFIVRYYGIIINNKKKKKEERFIIFLTLSTLISFVILQTWKNGHHTMHKVEQEYKIMEKT